MNTIVVSSIKVSWATSVAQEYNPLRDEFYGATGDPRTANKRKLYRFNPYGRDAAAFILDTRSFRDEAVQAYRANGGLRPRSRRWQYR